MNKKTTVVLTLVLIALGIWGIWAWMSHAYVEPGTSLLVMKKTGDETQANTYSSADKDQKGVLEQMRGPGTSWDLDPIGYDTQVIEDLVLLPPEMAVLKSKVGEGEAYIAGPNQRGIRKDVATPGTWKVNPYGLQVVEKKRAEYIPPGSVGVLTLLVGEKQGISKDVLQPGWYFINPFEAKLSKIPIGCWEYNVKVEFDEVEVNGVKVKKPREGTGISVPTSDGKRIYLDVSVIWGNLPEYCPYNLEEYGQVEDIEKKVIAPQLDSICLSEGRNLSTLSFIQGQEREKFQSRIDGDMKRVCHEKKIVVHIVVIRDFYPDPLIRATLQASKIAEEEKKTLEKEMVRDTVAAQLEKAKRIVATKVSDFDAETGKLVASEKALGQKEAAEKLAKAEQRVADLNKQAAEIMAEMVRISGKADADVVEAMKKADASKLVFEIQACGGAEQYNRITLADSLKDLQVRFIHTGPGTLWTNFSDLLKPDLEDVAAKKILEANQK